MHESVLQRVQTLQFTDQAAAESLLLDFIRETFALDVASLNLRPLATSLNSFNGFLMTVGGRRLFFKSHTESDTIIGEYYNAAMLAEAGYPVIQPVMSSTEVDKQLLLYEVIDDPAVFDVAWTLENERRDDMTLLATLREAQNHADDDLLRLYRATLAPQSAEEALKAPVHQLFYHRLTGGRLTRFYGPLPGESGEDVMIALPDGDHLMRDVRHAQWVINGQRYAESLDDIIRRAVDLLNPARADVSIVGHGDAHNGNVFLQTEAHPPRLLYFDPAFAGRHHPLLDLTKPLFHNVFAMWMYFPAEKRAVTPISLSIKGKVWQVDYAYDLPEVRRMFLTSKVARTLKPILRDLRERGQLRDDWRAMLKAALFCCPFLTMNLADPAKFPPEISLLGLAMAVEMGSESQQERSLIDRTLDDVAADLS